MSLIGAQLYCVNAAGTALTYTTKGNKFTVGSYLGCDLVLPDAERIHCEIQGDPFGRVTIYNHSSNKPILVNDQVVHAAAKRPLTHGARIEILQEVYIWKFPKTDDQLTPDRQPPQQASNSSPSFKGHRQRRQLDTRLTVHNILRYSINSDDEGNTSIEARELDTSTGSNAAEADESLPKVDLLEATQNKENTSTVTNKTMLKLCARSDMMTTSWSPRVTGVQTEKSFGLITQPRTDCSLLSVTTTPKSVYNTPKSVLSELNEDSCSRDLMEFSTPSTSKKAVAAKRASSMHFIDLTTPQRLRPAAKQTPASSAVISVDSTDESSDASPLVIDITNTSTPSTSLAKTQSRVLPKTPNNQLMAASATPKRTPQSLMKRALLTSAKKQLPVNNTTRTTPLATPGRQSLLEARRVCQTAPRRLPFHPRPQSRTPARRQLSALPAKAPLTSPRKRQSITFSNPRHTKSSQMRKTLAAAAKTNPGLSKSNKLVANACRALNSSPKHSSPKRIGSPNAASPQTNQSNNFAANDISTPALEHNSSAELSRTFTLNEDGDKVVHSPTVAALEEIAFSITDEYNGTSSLLDQSALKNLNESVQTMQIMSSTPNTSLTSAENAETSKIIDKNASFNDNSGTTPLNHTFDAHKSIEKTEDVLSTSAKADLSPAKDSNVSHAVAENVSSNNKSTTDEALPAEAQFVIEDSICEEVVTTPTNQEDTVSITHVRLDEDTICEEVPTVEEHTTNDAANLQKNQIEAEEEDDEVHDIVVAPPGQTPIPRRSSRRLSMEQQTISLTPRRSLRRPSMELSKQPTRRASCSATVEHHANGSIIATPKRKRRLTEEMSTPTRKSLRRIANTPKGAAPVDESVGDMGVVVEETTPQSAESEQLPVVEDYGNELPSSAADEPENIDYHGMRELLKTPKSCSTPRLRGLRELMRTPKMAASPCLENIEELLEGNSNDTSTTTTTTPKRQITVNRINLDISQTEPAASDAQDLYFKTPRGKNLMIPNEPASAVLQTRDNSLATTTEYDLNATNAPLHLDKIFDDVLTVETTNTAVDDSEAEINVTAVSIANATAADPLASSVASNMEPNNSISSEAMITVGHIENDHNDPLTSTAFKPSARADHPIDEYDDRAKSMDISGMSGIQLLDQTTDSMFSEHLIVSGVDSCDVTLEETNAIDNHSAKKDLRKDSSDTDSLVGLTEPLVVSDDDEQVDESKRASIQINNISPEQNATNVSSKLHECKSITYPIDDSQATLGESEKPTTNLTDKSLVKSSEESTFELNTRFIAGNATKDDASSENSALDRLEKEVDETSPPDEILAATFEKVLEMSSELSPKATVSFKILKYEEVIGAKGSTTHSNKSTELIEAEAKSQQNYSLNASSASQLKITDSIEAKCNTSSLIKEVDPVKETITQSAVETDAVPVPEQDDGTLFNESADTSGLKEANKVVQTLDKLQTPEIVLTPTETQVQTCSEVSQSAKVEHNDEPTTDMNVTAADVQEVQSALNKSSTQIEPSVSNASANETNIIEAQEEKAQLKDGTVEDEDVSKVTANEVAPRVKQDNMNAIDINKSVDILPRSSEESSADDNNDCESSVVELDASAINESNKAEEQSNEPNPEVVSRPAIKSLVEDLCSDHIPDKEDINESVIELDASNALETEDEANITQDEHEASEIVSAEDFATVPEEPYVTPVKNGAYESVPKTNEDSSTVGEDPNIAQMEASVVTEADKTSNDIEQAANNKLSKVENNAEKSIMDASPADQSYNMEHEDEVSDSIKHNEKTVLQVEEASDTCNSIDLKTSRNTASDIISEAKPTPVQSQQLTDHVESDLDSLLADQPNIEKQDEICEIIIAPADEAMPKVDDSAYTDVIELDASLSTELETPMEDRLESSVADQSKIKEQDDVSDANTAPADDTMPHNNDVIDLDASCNTELESVAKATPPEDRVELALQSSIADQSCIKEQDNVSDAKTAPADETMSHINKDVNVKDASCNTELKSEARSTTVQSQKSEENELKHDGVPNAKPAPAEEALPQDESISDDVIDLDASCSTELESGPKPTEDRVELVLESSVADQSNIKELDDVSDAKTAPADESMPQNNDVIDLDASCIDDLDSGPKSTPAEDRVELVLESSVADQSNIKEQNEVSDAIITPAEETLPPIDESTKNADVIVLDESINTELKSGPNPSPAQSQKLEDSRELKQDEVSNVKPATPEETLPQDESNDVIDLDASCSTELEKIPKPTEDRVELVLETSVADQSNINEHDDVSEAKTAPADETMPHNNDVIDLDASCNADLGSGPKLMPAEDHAELLLESSVADISNFKEHDDVSDAKTAPADETMPHNNDVIDLDASCNADLESEHKLTPTEDRVELALESSVADKSNVEVRDEISDPIIATSKTLPKADESRNIEEVIERDASCNTDNKIEPLPVKVEHRNHEQETTLSASSEAKAKVDTSDLRGDGGKSSKEIRIQENNLDTNSKNLLESEGQKSSSMETDEQVKDTLVSISYDQLIASEKIETTQTEIENQFKELAHEASTPKGQDKKDEDNISTKKSNEATLDEAQSNESNDSANTKSSVQVANVAPNEVIANEVNLALPTTESQVDIDPELQAEEKHVKSVTPETEHKITAEILEIPKIRDEPKKTSRRGRKPSKLVEAEAATAAQDIAGAIEHKRAGRKSTDAIAETNERKAHINIAYDDVMHVEEAPKAAQELHIESNEVEKPKSKNTKTIPIDPTNLEKPKRRGRRLTADIQPTADVEETQTSEQPKTKQRGGKSTPDVDEVKAQTNLTNPIVDEVIDLDVEETTSQDKKTEETRNVQQKPKRRGRKATADEPTAHVKQTAEEPIIQESIDLDQPIIEQTETQVDKKTEEPTDLEKPKRRGRKAKEDEKTAEETGVIEKPKRRGRKATADVVETETSADKVDATADKVIEVDADTHVDTNPEEAISLETPKRRGRKPIETETLEEKNLQMPDEANVVQPKRGGRGRKPSAEVVEAETQTKRRGRKASAEVVESPEASAETKESQSTNEQLEIIVEAAEPERKKPRLEAATNVDVEPKITRRGRKLSVASAIPSETVEALQASGSRAKSVPRRGRKATNDVDAVIVQAIEITEQPAQKPTDDTHPIELDSKEKSSRAKSVPRRGRKATNDADVKAIEEPTDDTHPIEHALDSKEKSSRAKSVPRRGRKATNDADAVIVQAIAGTEQKPTDDTHPTEHALDSKEKSTPPEEPLVEPPAEKKPARRGRKASAYVEPTLDEQPPVKKIAARRGRNASSVELVDQELATQVVEAHSTRAKSVPRRGRKATNDADAAIIPAVEATEVKAKDDDTQLIELDFKEKSIPPDEPPVKKKPTRRGRKALDEQPQVKKITARRGRKASPSAEPVDQELSAQVLEPDTIVSVPVSPKPQQLPSSEDELTPRRREGRNLPRKNYDETIYEDKVSAPARRGRKPAATKQATVTTAAKAIETETHTLPKPTTPETTVEPTVEPVVPQTPIMQNTTLPEPTSSQRREGRNVPRKNYSETSDDDKPGTSRGRRMRQPTIKALEQLAVTEVRSSTPKRRKGKADVVEEPLEKKPALEHSTPQPVPQSRTAARRKVADVAEVPEVVPVEVAAAPTAAKRGPRSRKASTTVQPEEAETDVDLPKQPAKRNARKAKAVEEQTDDTQPTTKKARGGARAKTPVVAEPAEAVNVDVDVDVVVEPTTLEVPTTKRAPAARGRLAKAAVKVPDAAEDVQQETTATPISRAGRGRKVHFEATEEANQTENQPAVADAAPKRATRSRRK